ncbi:MAG: ABC transporter permease [Acidimicrobiales bacterium]
MNELVALTVVGVVYGAVYAITASGLVVTYATSGVFNFAHGAVGMVAAFSYWELSVNHGLPVPLALAIVLLVEAPALGLLVELLFARQLHAASTERSLMVTLGLLLVLVGAASSIWSPESARILPGFFPGYSARVLGVNLTGQEILVVGVAVAVAGALWALLEHTRHGVAMKAIVDDPELLSMAGASHARIARSGWVLGSVLAAIAGILLAPLVTLDITTLTLLVVNGYAAAVVGRLKNLPLTFMGGIALGLLQSYAVGYMPQSWQSWLPGIRTALPMLFLFAVLLVLPHDRIRAAGQAVARRAPRVAGGRESLGWSVGLAAVAIAAGGLLSGIGVVTVSQGFAYGIIALSMVLLTGYAGQVSLAQLTFAGVGAFVAGRLSGGSTWLGILAAVAIAGALGVLVALPAMRLKGLYLALSTLAFAQAATYVFFDSSHVFGTGGALAVGRPGIPGIDVSSGRAELVVLAVAFALCAIGVLALRRSTLGRRLVAMSDSPAACATLGLSQRPLGIAAFGMSAALAGFGGALYGGLQGQVGANDFGLFGSMTLLLLAVIFGVRTVSGALVAGMAFAALPVLQSHVSWMTDLLGVVTGAGVVLVGRMPNGIFGMERPDRRAVRSPAAAARVPEANRHAELAGDHASIS